MDQRDGWIWFDGGFVPWQEAKVHALTHTLHYGTGVFEGVRAYRTARGTAIFRLQDHTRRLFDSARVLGIEIPFSRDEINRAQKDAIKRNNLATGYLRPIVFYGAEGMGLRADDLKVHCIVACWEWGTYLGEENMKTGVCAKTCSFARYHPNAAVCRAKVTGYYINSVLALQEALAAGYDEALMLDIDGNVAEGSGENVFLVSNGELYTPQLDAILDGITRRTVMQLAREQGLAVTEKRITPDEAYAADEIFFTGTAAEITPVRELDRHVIGGGKRGPVTEKLQSLFFDVVHGRTADHNEWLSFV